MTNRRTALLFAGQGAQQVGMGKDLVEKYPDFFWSSVQPYIEPALKYLELTTEGKQWVASLYNNIFQVEHRMSYFGPFPGKEAAKVVS